MTKRENEIFETLKRLGGEARPTEIGKDMGISADYAEQLCRDMVWMGHFIKHGLRYAIVERK
ncbi:MAG: hypothetical protein ACE5I8_02745 [Thermodesulfobacteriota bacterium]